MGMVGSPEPADSIQSERGDLEEPDKLFFPRLRAELREFPISRRVRSNSCLSRARQAMYGMSMTRKLRGDGCTEGSGQTTTRLRGRVETKGAWEVSTGR